MAPRAGHDPATFALTEQCSTNWTIGEHGAGGRIWTADIKITNFALYQTELRFQMTLRAGLEPATCRLTAERSTNWANGAHYP